MPTSRGTLNQTDHVTVRGEALGREDRLRRQRVQPAASEVPRLRASRRKHVQCDEHDEHDRAHQDAGGPGTDASIQPQRLASSKRVVRNSAPMPRLRKYTLSLRGTWPRLNEWKRFEPPAYWNTAPAGGAVNNPSNVPSDHACS